MTASRTLHGIGVSPGVAYAPAMVVDWRFPDIPDRAVDADGVEGEIARLRQAVDQVVAHLEGLKQAAQIFDDKTHHATERALAVLEPAIILLISGVVGGIIYVIVDALMAVNDLLI